MPRPPRRSSQWTLERIATVIERLTGVQHHPAHVWTLLRHRFGWTVQRPKRRAAEQMQAALAAMPIPEARAAMSLTRDATAVNGEIIDER
jgi:hypothetical protein